MQARARRGFSGKSPMSWIVRFAPPFAVVRATLPVREPSRRRADVAPIRKPVGKGANKPAQVRLLIDRVMPDLHVKPTKMSSRAGGSASFAGGGATYRPAIATKLSRESPSAPSKSFAIGSTAITERWLKEITDDHPRE